jgi:hypothetical protein
MLEENDDYDEAADLALEAKLKQEAKERLEALKRAREAEEAAQRVRLMVYQDCKAEIVSLLWVACLVVAPGAATLIV